MPTRPLPPTCWRTATACLLALFLVACSEWGEDRRTLPEKLPPVSDHNVLVISFDALRTDHLPFHGYERNTAPRLTALAERSLVFDRHYAAAQATPTSFAGAWTGRLPFRVFRGWSLRDEETLAALFGEAGWNTAAFVNNVQLVADRRFDVGFDTYEVFSTEDVEVLAAAVEWLDQAEEPFFAWIHFISPHTPYDPMPGSESFYDPDYEGRYADGVPGEFDVRDEAELERVIDLYDGEIFHADGLFGAIEDELARNGLDDRTVVMVTADHGEQFLDHGGLQHNDVWNEIIQVPMIVHHPAMRRGARHAGPTSGIDLYPTLRDWFGFPGDKVTDGLSWLAEQPAARPIVVPGMTHATDRYWSIEQGPWKLHVHCRPEYVERLYDRASDPGETHDMVLDGPEIAGELFETLTLIAGGEPCAALQEAIKGATIETGLDEETIEQLRSLGYIQ